MKRILRLVCSMAGGAALVAAATLCGAQDHSERNDPSVNLPCPECGAIFDIREQKRERESARTAPSNPDSTKWTIRLTLGDKADPHPHVDLIGSRAMREAMTETYYVVVVRFDDNRWQRIEVADREGLKIGDRVHVHQNRIESDDRN